MSEQQYTSEQLKTFEEGWRKLSKKVEVADVAGLLRRSPPQLEDIPRFRPALWPPAKKDLPKNLQKYVNLALALGAVDAKTIPCRDIPQDLRALYVGCVNPACRWLNTSAFCPMVMTSPFEQMKEFLASYEYAIVYKVLPPVLDGVPDVGPINLDLYYSKWRGEPPDKAMLGRNIIRLRILSEIKRRIRQAVFYDGYIVTSSVSEGPCLVFKCADVARCPALEKQGRCPFMDVEPVGSGVAYIDYHTLGRNLGWGELQVGGNCAFPEDEPNAAGYYNIGLVLID